MKDHSIEVFDPNKAILFRNWTNDPFSWAWDGNPYTFQPGETRYFPEGLAHHFAKHLTDYVLLKDGKDVDDQSRPELYQKALMASEPIVSHSDVGLEVELLNKAEEAKPEAVEEPKEEKKDPRVDNLAKARAAKAAKRHVEADFAGMK